MQKGVKQGRRNLFISLVLSLALLVGAGTGLAADVTVTDNVGEQVLADGDTLTVEDGGTLEAKVSVSESVVAAAGASASPRS